MPLIPKSEFHDWDYGNPQRLECKNHPVCKYYWKGPGRNLHYASTGLTPECTCSVNDLVVVVDQPFTITTMVEIGTYHLSNSGPTYRYAVKGGSYLIATFENECEDFAKDFVEELAPKYQDGWITLTLTD